MKEFSLFIYKYFINIVDTKYTNMSIYVLFAILFFMYAIYIIKLIYMQMYVINIKKIMKINLIFVYNTNKNYIALDYMRGNANC